MISNRGPVTSNVSGWPTKFNTFVNDWDDGVECTLSKVADDAKLGGVIYGQDGCAAVQTTLAG